MTRATRLTRPLALLLGAVLAAAALVATVPAPASAAWQTSTVVHGAKLQVCKRYVDGQNYVRFRLDNRQARHTHLGGLSRTRNGETRTFNVRAAAGRISQVVQLPVRPSDRFSTGVGELTGEGAGGGTGPLSTFPRC